MGHSYGALYLLDIALPRHNAAFITCVGSVCLNKTGYGRSLDRFCLKTLCSLAGDIEDVNKKTNKLLLMFNLSIYFVLIYGVSGGNIRRENRSL